MNTFSLSFFQKALEVEYQAYNTKNQRGVFGRNLLFYGIIACTIGLYFFIIGSWSFGIMLSCYGLFVAPFIYTIAKKVPLYFDFVCFIFQSAIVLSIPGIYFLDVFKQPYLIFDFLLGGQIVVFIVQGFNLGSRFNMKAIVILINILAQSSMRVVNLQGNVAIILFWIGSSFIILNYVYWQDRNQREAFLIKYNEKVWQQEIGSFAQICIITCVSDKGLLKPELYKSNQKSQQEFNIYDQDSFKQFLNNVTLVPKKKLSLKIMNEMKSSKKLKNYQKLHTYIYKLSESVQVQNQEFFGFYNQILYDVKIFTTWKNQLMNINALLTKSSNFTESVETLKHEYENKLFTDYRQQTGNSIKRIFIRLKQIGLMNRLQKENGSLISDVYNALRLNYNIQLFLNPEYSLNKAQFFLSPIINEIKILTMNSMPKPFQLYMKCLIDYNLELFSCQKTLYQILFNLFTIIIRPAKQSGFIQITAKKKLNVLRQTYINFEITTNVSSIRNLLDNQNYQRNTQGQKLSSYIHNKNVGLEMVVSEYLIGKIGPKRSIKLVRTSEDEHYISFNIYQDLNHLIQ